MLQSEFQVIAASTNVVLLKSFCSVGYSGIFLMSSQSLSVNKQKWSAHCFINITTLKERIENTCASKTVLSRNSIGQLLGHPTEQGTLVVILFIFV